MSDDLLRRRILAGLAGALWGFGGTGAYTAVLMFAGLVFGFGMYPTFVLAMPAMALVFALLMAADAGRRSPAYVMSSLRYAVMLTATSLGLIWLLLSLTSLP